MKSRLIIYQLENTKEDYPKVFNHIKEAFSEWAKPTGRCFIVKSNKKTSAIRDELKKAINGKGVILVINVTEKGWASSKVSSNVTSWMKENL